MRKGGSVTKDGLNKQVVKKKSIKRPYYQRKKAIILDNNKYSYYYLSILYCGNLTAVQKSATLCTVGC